MRAAELGAFLRSRRSRVSPAEVGLPAGPADRRRSPGLRREEVASLAGVAVSWLARLEQGRAHSVSSDVLGALANALRLDDVERAHLFALGGYKTGGTASPPDPVVTDAMRALLDALEPDPAYVLDRRWDFVAWNDAEAALFPGLLAYSAEGNPNLLEMIFHDDALRRLMADHAEEQVRLVAQFRVHCTDWPDDRELDMLVDGLQQTSPEFARLWAAEDVAPFVTTRRLFDHPVAGRLEFDHHRFAALDQPGAQLVVYTPVPGTDSAARLHSCS